jgi:glyoxylase-like metal-dependent hydrolase (beta-lactamase superfamily II)
MKVHHLNCATMCQFGARWINGSGSVFSPARLVCHVLLVESDQGLVLVDTGIGLADVAEPRERLGGPFVGVARPRCDPAETAARQVERLGFSRSDVRHVAVTHLDLDHAGGLPDFPDAQVHVYEPEKRIALERPDAASRMRYRLQQLAHGPRWTTYSVLDGERWFGFECVRALQGLPEGDIAIVPVVGHSAGHSAIAVNAGDHWLVHAGDAYFHRGEMGARYECTPALRLFQRLAAWNDDARVRNRERLRAAVQEHGKALRVFSAHDPFELDAFSQS